MPIPFNNDQASLGIHHMVVLQGAFPPRDGTGDPDGIYLASIRSFAGNFAWAGTAFADGQILSISQNTALFSILGTTFGGNGQSTFALPDLRGRAPVGAPTINGEGTKYGADTVTLTGANAPGGGAQPFVNDQASLTVNYFINVGGTPPASSTTDVLGMVVPFLGNFTPTGYHLADGALLDINTNQALFTLIGTTYGGNGQTTFALPDLRNRTIIGDSPQHVLGSVAGQDQTTIINANLPTTIGGSGTAIDNHQPSLALHYLIATQGVFPSRDGGGPDNHAAELGEIIAYAGTTIPTGWALASGQLLSINQNQALFSLLGTTYGGNGQTTFALPDLRNHVAIEAGQGPGLQNVALGQQYGSDTINLLESNLPLPTVTINQASSQGDPSGAHTLLFDVVFSENVSGFTASDVVLSGTAGATSVTVIPGIDAAHYSLSIKGMAQSGTVVASIASHATNSVANGLASTVSTSTDNQITYIEHITPRDFNGDANSDFLWRNDDGGVVTWSLNNTQFDSFNFGQVDNSWQIAGTGDFNGDNKIDMLWRNTNGAVVTWDMNNHTYAGFNFGQVDNAMKIAGTGDFNGDGKDDILWRNSATGNVVTWDMNDHTYVSFDFGQVDPSWKIAGTGDFNGDGKTDILWRNDNGDVVTWDMNDHTYVGFNFGNVDNSWKIAGTGDFNGDGRSDILWRNDNGSVVTWDMNDHTYVGFNFGNVSAAWKIAGTGFFNNDSRSDILWRNDNGQVVTWNMNDHTYTGVDHGNVVNAWHLAA